MLTSVLRTVAKTELRGYTVDTSQSLVDTLVSMTMSVLHLDEDEALSLLKVRLSAHSKKEAGAAKALMEVDEAVQCLEPNDINVVHKEQEKGEKRAASHKEFVAEWKAKRKSVKACSKNNPKKTKGKAPPHSARGRASCPVSLLPVGDLMVDQQQVKKFMPEGSFIWKSRHDGTWHTRVPPFGTCSRSIQKHTEQVALRLVISHAWKDWCDLEGVEYGECPMQGLMDFGVLDQES